MMERKPASIFKSGSVAVNPVKIHPGNAVSLMFAYLLHHQSSFKLAVIAKHCFLRIELTAINSFFGTIQLSG